MGLPRQHYHHLHKQYRKEKAGLLFHVSLVFVLAALMLVVTLTTYNRHQQQHLLLDDVSWPTAGVQARHQPVHESFSSMETTQSSQQGAMVSLTVRQLSIAAHCFTK